MSAPEPDDTGTWSISEATSFRLELLVACSERTSRSTAPTPQTRGVTGNAQPRLAAPVSPRAILNTIKKSSLPHFATYIPKQVGAEDAIMVGAVADRLLRTRPATVTSWCSTRPQ